MKRYPLRFTPAELRHIAHVIEQDGSDPADARVLRRIAGGRTITGNQVRRLLNLFFEADERPEDSYGKYEDFIQRADRIKAKLSNAIGETRD